MAKKGVEVARVAGQRYWRAAEAEVVVEAWKRSGEGLGAFAERSTGAQGSLSWSMFAPTVLGS